MKESIGYTVTLNIVIIFITIIIAFFWFALIYFKSNKASNIITTSIEKHEGYNSLSISEIERTLNALGYGSHSIDCAPFINDKGANKDKNTTEETVGQCFLTNNPNGNGLFGYCVYECYEKDEDDNYEYYYFKIRTNMMIGVPIINEILDFPIYSNTNRLYNFE